MKSVRGPNPLENRARELAVAAGLNPDDRAVKVGSERGMPIWCTFTDAARSEFSAEKAKLATAEIAVVDQPSAYKNSPLTVIGAHEDNTILQMRNCMMVGNVVAGVMCADGHLGYAQPVGGVVAYKDQISISGVGFDIGCFAGNTQVFTLDGNHSYIKDLVDKDVWILSCTESGKVVPARGRGVKTQLNAPLIKVNIDNNSEVLCTYDQKFMLLDGSYKEASYLQANDRLMPLYFTHDNDGYVLVRPQNRANSSVENQHCVLLQSMIKKCGLLGEEPQLISEDDGIIVHHKDGNILNNDPTNLKMWSRSRHASYHTMLRDWSYKDGEEFEANRLQGIEDFWEIARTDKKFMDKRKSTATTNITSYMENNSDHFKESIKDNGKRGREYLLKHNQNSETIRRNRELAKFESPCPICRTLVAGTNQLYWHAKRVHPTEHEAVKSIKDSRHTYKEKLIAVAQNHKVVSVEFVDIKEDVYCLQVPNYNNFALLSGIFVHNCGNKAVRLDIKFIDIKHGLKELLESVARSISFGVGRKNNERVEHALFDNNEAWLASDMEDYKKKAREQLGTVGSGNHYIDIMYDEEGYVWLGVHFGSRGLGHTIATKYVKAAGGKDGIHVPPTVVDVDSELGVRYLAGMHLAGSYAYAGRDWVVERVRQIVGGEITDSVHNHHNFAWLEEHNGQQVWVVRKGATPAFPGQRGFVGGSMGDDAVILKGVDSPKAKAALYSTVHGAGRLYGRKEAKRRFTQAEMDRWLQERGVTLIGSELDESPMAYRRLSEVLNYHASSTEIEHRLRPIGVIMAGSGDFDPFKD
jgi:tRNA-splicing ligase RtcB